MKYRTKQHPTLNDIEDAYKMIDDFERSLPPQELYQCADTSVLLVESSEACGIANFAVTMNCQTVSITRKACATGYYR